MRLNASTRAFCYCLWSRLLGSMGSWVFSRGRGMFRYWVFFAVIGFAFVGRCESPDEELLAFLAAAESAKGVRYEAKSFQPREMELAKQEGLEIVDGARLFCEYSGGLRDGNRYRFREVTYSFVDGQLMPYDTELAFDGIDRYSINWGIKEGLIYSGGANDFLASDPTIAYGFGMLGVGKGIPEFIRNGHRYITTSRPHEYVFVDVVGDGNGYEDDIDDDIANTHAFVVLDPDRGYAPSELGLGMIVNGDIIPGSVFRFLEGKFVGGVWLPTVVKRFSTTNGKKDPDWKLERIIHYEPESLSVGEAFSAEDFQIDFPIDSGYKDQRTGLYVGTPLKERLGLDELVQKEQGRGPKASGVNALPWLLLMSAAAMGALVLGYRKWLAPAGRALLCFFPVGCDWGHSAASPSASNVNVHALEFVGGDELTLRSEE